MRKRQAGLTAIFIIASAAIAIAASTLFIVEVYGEISSHVPANVMRDVTRHGGIVISGVLGSSTTIMTVLYVLSSMRLGRIRATLASSREAVRYTRATRLGAANILAMEDFLIGNIVGVENAPDAFSSIIENLDKPELVGAILNSERTHE